MKRVIIMALLLGIAFEVQAHNFGVTPITWNREISRIVFANCASCHREGGTSFSLVTYQDAQPRAVAMRDAVLSRRMPPWGAVQGFGDFRNDQGLTQEQIELITDWVESGMIKGNNPNVLPKKPKFDKPRPFKKPKNGTLLTGELRLDHAVVLDGLLPENVPQGASMQIVAELPDGNTLPLLWLYEYKNEYQHPFLLRKPLDLPVGTVISGVLPGSGIVLIPRTRK